MRIEGRCRKCGRDFPIDLLIRDRDRAGRCPFCGVPIDQHYGGLLIEALEQLQRAGTTMEATLKRAESVGPNLEIKAESVLDPIRDAIRAREAASAQRKATEEASEAERAADQAAGPSPT